MLSEILDPSRPSYRPKLAARRRVVLTHELGHLFGPPNVTLALASKLTLGRVDASAWAADKGPLCQWTDDEDDMGFEVLASCDESAIFEAPSAFEAAEAERIADRFAMERCMPAAWLNRYAEWRISTGRPVDEEATLEMSEILTIPYRICQRWQAFYEATGQAKYASNSGAWDRGDKLADLQNTVIDPDWESEPEFVEPDI